MAFTWGSSSLSSFHFSPWAVKLVSLCSRRPRLFLNPRSIASLKESGNTSPVALPSGTLPENGLWLRAAPGLLDWLLLDWPSLYEDELDCGAGAGASDWPDADWHIERKLARTYDSAIRAKDILLCRNGFLGLRSLIDNSQGHKQPSILMSC